MTDSQAGLAYSNDSGALSRRDFVKGAAAAAPLTLLSETEAADRTDGTPEQVHLTWGQDPATSVVVSWVTPGPAVRPRVIVHAAGGHAPQMIQGVQRTYTDGMNGQTVYTYHARITGLEADSVHRYTVTADNDRGSKPFAASFRTAPQGRRPFRFTSYGDLATPVSTWRMSSSQSRHAVDAVERFEPLFHLLNGDLCYANLNPHAQPQVWADFGHNVQRSAAYRPWMPCPGNHEIEHCNGPHGLDAYLTRYSLPDNATPFPGCWYRFRVGAVLFISLSADDVVYQDAGAAVDGPEPLLPASSTGNPPIPPGTSVYIRGYSQGEQTRWLEETLQQARADNSIDWIIVQMHQDALSSSLHGNGSDRGLREAWLPLFDRYGVDLVLCGHDHDYERSWPVRGCNHDAGRDAATGDPVDTCQPQPVVTAEPTGGGFDTTRGTIHLILGGGGTSAPLDVYGVNEHSGAPQAKVITRRNQARPDPEMPGMFWKPGADALEDAIWSARRDTVTGYGIAVFDYEPGGKDGRTSITMRYYHAAAADRAPTPAAAYELYDTLVISKERRDLRG